MDLIFELSTIVSKQKIKNIDLLDSNSKGNTTYELYKAISSEEIKTEQDALNHFYDGDETKTQTLRKNLTRLRKKLLNHLFFIDTNLPQFSEFQRAYLECLKNVSIIKILFDRGARKLAIEITERTISVALKYKFADVVVSLSAELYYHYGVLEHKKGRFEKYIEINEIYNRHLINENKVLRYYSTFANFFLQGQGGDDSKEIILDYGKSVIEKTRYLLSETPTYKLQLIGNILISGYYEVSNDIIKQTEICELAFTKLSSEEDYPKTGRNIFGQKLVFCYMRMRQFEKAIGIAENIVSTYVQGSVNWFNLHIYLLLLYLHSKEYPKAIEIYNTVIQQKKFAQVSKGTKEFWIIAKPYLYFLSNSNFNNSESSTEGIKKFRVYKFLNEVPLYSKDKRGYNISILIAHVLLLIVTKKYDNIIDRVETLNQYCYRYLRKDETYRSNCFIKMLLQLPKGGFHPLRVERYAKKYKDKLLKVPIAISKQPTEIELIPYEDLWEMVILQLQNNLKK